MDRTELSENSSPIGSNRSLPQSSSSVLSPQSLTPSHFQNLGLHNLFLQVMASELHSGDEMCSNAFSVITDQAVPVAESCSLCSTTQWDLLQFISSLKSPQSLQPSHCSSFLMHCWFLHWNWFGQAVIGRINIYRFITAHEKKIAESSDALTVFDVDGLICCLETSVYVGFVGEKHHFHCVGVAGHSHLVVRLLSTNSEDERHMQSHVSPRLMLFI